MMDDQYERTSEGAAPEGVGVPPSAAGPPPPAGWSEPAGSAGPGTAVPPGYTSYRGYAGTPVPPRPLDAPSPGLAALLGLIPGVGAMYNGQFAKGLAHLAIFAVLVSLADNVNGIFGVFVAGWIFYQAFEAYHTARARRDGLPLPNAFGLNDIGERLGFGKNWPNFQSFTPNQPTPNQPAGAQPSSTQPAAGSPFTGSQAQPYSPPSTPYAQPSPTTGANWAGYIPPQAFAQTPPASVPYPGPAAFPQQSPSANAPNWTSIPPTYPATPAGDAVTAMPPVVPDRRFPVGAVVLIAVGAIFLLSNLAPAWRLSGRWLLPLLLAAAAVWSLIRRLDLSARGLRPALRGRSLICAVRVPIVLFVLAVMFFFQAAGWLTIGQSWPLLLIVLGVLLLLERTLGRVAPEFVPVSTATSAMPPAADPGEGSAR